MTSAATNPRSGFFGRERELEHVVRFLNDPVSPSVLVLEGPAGIGKTALWRCATETAAACGVRVLSCRCAEEETALGFQALADLFEGLEDDLVAALPTPKRDALKAALLLNDSHHTDERAARAGAMEVLRSASARRTLVIAIDDWPWIDPETLAVLRFTARRLRDEPIRFLLTVRASDEPAKPEVPELGLKTEHLKLRPLSLTIIARLVYESVGVKLTRPELRRLYELSEGNPLLALQLASAAAVQPQLDSARHSLPLPERLQTSVADRIAALSASQRAALLAVACSHGMPASEIRELFSDEILEGALSAGVVSEDGARIRAAHPLFGEVAVGTARPAVLRETHRRLAEVTRDPERRALHLAEAATEPNSEVARTLEAAAAGAARRGAATTAAALAERAFKLTPRGDEAWGERLLNAAQYSNLAGTLRQTDELLSPLIDQLAPGPQRGHARFLLADASSRDEPAELRLALADVAAPTPLRAAILAELAEATAIGDCAGLSEAEAYAREALAIAAGHEPATSSLIWIEAMRGSRPHERGQRPTQVELRRSPLRPRAVELIWHGSLSEARRELERLSQLADDRGEGESYFFFRHHLAELELRAARWAIVEELLAEHLVARGESIAADSALLVCQAQLAVGRGHGREAARLARAAIKEAGRVVWQRLDALRALGAAQLLAEEPGAAASTLSQVWEHTEREGIDNPGTFPVAPDLVEALALSGQVAGACVVAQTLQLRATRQRHPWARAAAASARGQVALAERDDRAAAETFADAAERFEALGMPLDRGRSLTHLGIAQRRLRQRRAARGTLEAAVGLLTELGSPGWALRAERELGRIAGRRASGQALTPTEARVAELVAGGLANKQIASALTISVSAVEAHLTRIYAKLGVSSRTALVGVVTNRASASATGS